MNKARIISELGIHTPEDGSSVTITCGYHAGVKLEIQNVAFHENYNIQPVAPGEMQEVEEPGLVLDVSILLTEEPEKVEEPPAITETASSA